MYKNCGAKVKGLATFIAVLGMIAAVIGGVAFIAEEEYLLAIVFVVVGCLGAWLGGLFMAAFGELVQNSYEILQILKKNNAPAAPVSDIIACQAPVAGKCPNCGGQNKPGAAFCAVCGSKL